MNFRFQLLAMSCCALLLAACGGGGGNSDGPSGAVLSGVVEDGPVSGARVMLQDPQGGEVARLCGASGVGRCETLTAADGSFSLGVRAGAALDGLELVADGGLDRDTGVEFAGIRLRTPLELFRGREDRITISPLTSLVAGRLRQSGATFTAALDEVSRWLLLAPGADLGSRPSEDRELLRHALLLTALALELSRTGESDPLAKMGDSLHPDFPLVTAEGLSAGELAAYGLDEGAQRRLAALGEALQSEGGSLAAAFRRTAIRQGIEEIVERMLGDGGGFDPENGNYQQNVAVLAEKVLAAAGPTVIPLGGIAPQRIARYVLFTYGLTSFDRFTVETTAFTDNLQHPDGTLRLEEDPRIAELAALRALYSTSVPLLNDEIPGDDNQQRLRYFYSSDLSPLYRAEQLAGLVFDDQANDAIMLEVVKGKAAHGFLDEARAIANSQIFQSEYRALALRELAESLIRYGHNTEAVVTLVEAEALYRKVIDVKGAFNLTKTDVANLQQLAITYRHAGALEAAVTMLEYVETIVKQVASVTTYGLLVIETRNVADELLAAGEDILAGQLVDSLYRLAAVTPPNGTAGDLYYQARVYYLLETASRYADLEQWERVEAVVGEVKALRTADGLNNNTAAETWSYMPAMVELLYRAGKTDEALAAAESIPYPAYNRLGKALVTDYRSKAFKVVATFEALNLGVDVGIARVEEFFTTNADKVEALTYFALNEGSAPYIAKSLINAGRLAEAEQALDRAAVLVEGIQPVSDQERYLRLLQQGYVKLAGLYCQVGRNDQAAVLLGRAEVVLADLTAPKYLVDGRIDIALGHHARGDRASTLRLLGDAFGEAEKQTVPPLTWESVAALHEAVVKGYLNAGVPGGAIPALDAYRAAVMNLFDQGIAYTGDNHDLQAGKEVDGLLKAANFYTLAGELAAARAALEAARMTAEQIYKESSLVGKFINSRPYVDPVAGYDHLVGGFARIGDSEGALAMIFAKKESGDYLLPAADRYQAIQWLAKYLTKVDAFPDTAVANIDTDRDGRPDFFHPLATPGEIEASGLVLDDDSDSDGIPDRDDRRPLFADLAEP